MMLISAIMSRSGSSNPAWLSSSSTLSVFFSVSIRPPRYSVGTAAATRLLHHLARQLQRSRRAEQVHNGANLDRDVVVLDLDGEVVEDAAIDHVEDDEDRKSTRLNSSH